MNREHAEEDPIHSSPTRACGGGGASTGAACGPWYFFAASVPNALEQKWQ